MKKYLAPKDLFGGTIKKGTIYSPLSSPNVTTYAALKGDGSVMDSGKTNLPKEIVEEWEVLEERLKIGDYVYILNRGSEVIEVLNDTGKKHTGAKEGDVVFIMGISDKNGYAHQDDPRYYGENFNLRGEDLRLATEKEIAQLKNFQAGDYVTCLPGFLRTNTYHDPLYGGFGYKEGLTFKIRERNKEVCFSEGSGGVYVKALRTATKEEIEKLEGLKVGNFKVEFHNFEDENYVTIGCQSFNKFFISRLELLSKVTSVKINDILITPTLLKTILKKL